MTECPACEYEDLEGLDGTCVRVLAWVCEAHREDEK